MKRTTLTILLITLLLLVPTLALAQTDTPEPVPTIEPTAAPVDPEPDENPPFSDLVPELGDTVQSVLSALILTVVGAVSAVAASPFTTSAVNLIKRIYPDVNAPLAQLAVSVVAVVIIWIARPFGAELLASNAFELLTVIMATLATMVTASGQVYRARKYKDDPILGYNASPKLDPAVGPGTGFRAYDDDGVEIKYVDYDPRPRG